MAEKDDPHSCLKKHVCVFVCVCMVTHIAELWINRYGKVANPARGQLNRKNEYFPVRIRV